MSQRFLPEAARAALEAVVGPIRGMSPVSGGCISEAWRVETDAGPVFLKQHQDAPPGLFAAEADGLRALRSAAGGLLRFPQVIAVDPSTVARWIALEWLEPAPRGRDFGERLGRGLAAVHRAAGDGWGWETQSFIGPLPQRNAPAETWAAFWRDRRLRPQLDAAVGRGQDVGTMRDWERLFARLPELLAAAEGDGPSLLHGDLWSGNVLATAEGPALIDPAVYRGHREADLAITELFGGFDARFHAAYEEAWPLAPGYREVRRGIYQLYYLLVHAVLFGGSYAGQTAATLRRVLDGGAPRS